MTARISPIHLGGFFCVGAVLGALVACFLRDRSIVGAVLFFLPSAAVPITLGVIPYILGGYLSPFKGKGYGPIESRLAFLTGSIYAFGVALIPRSVFELAFWIWACSPFAVSFVTPFFSARLSRQESDQETEDCARHDQSGEPRIGGENISAESTETHDRKRIQQLRWTARILGGCVAAHFTVVTLVGSQGMSGGALLQIVFGFLGIADLGFVVAWLWESLGGAMMIVGGVGVAVSLIGEKGGGLVGGLYIGLPFVFFGALFLICWWRARSGHQVR